MRRHGNMAFAVVFFVIGILMFVFTKDFAYNGLMDFGAGFWPRIIAVIMMACAVMILFCVILYLFGLCIALAVMFCGIMLAMHERRWWMLAIFSVSMPVFIYVVFQVLLRVKLPMGIIFS